MTSRTTQTTATFHHPCSIQGIEGEVPAGSYVVETDEELIPGLSFLAYRRIRTSITVPGPAGNTSVRQIVDIDPDALADALMRDALPGTATSAPT